MAPQREQISEGRVLVASLALLGLILVAIAADLLGAAV
jgi:hypothetical protein